MSPENNLEFPDKLVVRLIEEDKGYPVSGIVIRLTLYAKQKNNYHFGPRPSDQSGTIIIEREWVERSIHETRVFFLMDYGSNLGDCYPYVDLSVMTAEDIQHAIEAGELYGDTPAKLGVAPSVSKLGTASNHMYASQTVRVTLNGASESLKEVVIKLRRQGT